MLVLTSRPRLIYLTPDGKFRGFIHWTMNEFPIVSQVIYFCTCWYLLIFLSYTPCAGGYNPLRYHLWEPDEDLPFPGYQARTKAVDRCHNTPRSCLEFLCAGQRIILCIYYFLPDFMNIAPSNSSSFVVRFEIRLLSEVE
jgi:hypothetical protein